MRALTPSEQQKLKVLTENSVSLTLIEPTETGLKKSIMDATGPVRNYLLENNLHNYADQKQGQDHKVIISSILLHQQVSERSSASLYRPNTKNGDPRIWFSGLTKMARPNDLLGLIAYEGVIYVFNLTRLPVQELIESKQANPLKDLVYLIGQKVGAVSQELLGKLRKIAARGPMISMLDADTSVGRTLEKALGIDINSSKKPDYKGIELKAYRDKRGNRKNLFAQVANWELSKLKGSEEILDKFGYWRGEDFKLYCTVSAKTRNSQGLRFRVDNDLNWLLENSDKPKIGDFAVWTLAKLHERLLEKHGETFWIAADSSFEDGKEYFHYREIEHTKKPIVSQFDILLEQGIITMDHLIKRNVKGKVKEKGPIFKIRPNSLALLFPPSTYHYLG